MILTQQLEYGAEAGRETKCCHEVKMAYFRTLVSNRAPIFHSPLNSLRGEREILPMFQPTAAEAVGSRIIIGICSPRIENSVWGGLDYGVAWICEIF